MFSIAEKPDNIVVLNGVTYVVDLSFDNILLLYELLNEDTDELMKIQLGIQMMLKTLPHMEITEQVEVFKKLLDEFVLDQEKEEPMVDLKGDPLPVHKEKEYFSLKYDAKYVYAGFMQAYGIDLIEQQGKLGWKKFKALLEGLPANTRLNEIIEIRKRPYPRGKGSENERRELQKAKRQFSYPGMDFTKIEGE
jgi:hypothetical protein